MLAICSACTDMRTEAVGFERIGNQYKYEQFCELLKEENRLAGRLTYLKLKRELKTQLAIEGMTISKLMQYLYDTYEEFPFLVTMLHASESPIHASAEDPRLVIYTNGLLLAVQENHVEKSGKFNAGAIEIMAYDCPRGRWGTDVVRYAADGKLKLFEAEDPLPGGTRTKNNCASSQCHTENDPRPNWEAYNIWPKTFGLTHIPSSHSAPVEQDQQLRKDHDQKVQEFLTKHPTSQWSGSIYGYLLKELPVPSGFWLSDSRRALATQKRLYLDSEWLSFVNDKITQYIFPIQNHRFARKLYEEAQKKFGENQNAFEAFLEFFASTDHIPLARACSDYSKLFEGCESGQPTAVQQTLDTYFADGSEKRSYENPHAAYARDQKFISEDVFLALRRPNGIYDPKKLADRAGLSMSRTDRSEMKSFSIALAWATLGTTDPLSYFTVPATMRPLYNQKPWLIFETSSGDSMRSMDLGVIQSYIRSLSDKGLVDTAPCSTSP